MYSQIINGAESSSVTDTDETIREQLEVFRSSNEPEVVWSEEDRSQFAKIMKEQGIESQRMKEAL